MKIVLLLFAVLTVINVVAIWGIVSSRNSARALALQDLQLQTIAHARAVEAVLASRRGDFIFLSQSPQFANVSALLSEPDPMAKRWRRLEIEGSLLLFMAAHPEVEHIVLRDSSQRPLIAAGRRAGAPVLLPAQNFSSRLPEARGFVRGTWPLGQPEDRKGTLEVCLNTAELLNMVAPGMSSKLSLRQGMGELLESLKGDLVVSAPIRDDGWNPPISWVLVRREDQSSLVQSVAELAARYRRTVILNVTVIGLALALGVLALQQVRRRVALEAENRQQVRIRELERQVLHNERLASIGRLAAGIAHEINNPLEGMYNYLTLLAEDLRAGRTEESLQMVERVREGLDRAAKVIRQVLAFSEPGKAPKTLVDINAVLAETVDFVRSNPSFRHVKIQLETPQQELRVLGNRTTLGQLFLNLLLNACQARPQDGSVQICSSRRGDQVIVTVSDNGPGISEADLARIFEPFYSTRGSTGLGLSICHGIVTQHGGEIRAQNRQQGGAMFEVKLPIGDVSENRAQQ